MTYTLTRAPTPHISCIPTAPPAQPRRSMAEDAKRCNARMRAKAPDTPPAKSKNAVFTSRQAEWLAVIPDRFTRVEATAIWGKSRDGARDRIRALIRSGKVVHIGTMKPDGRGGVADLYAKVAP
jgi:predicted HTH transcriptional regulator